MGASTAAVEGFTNVSRRIYYNNINVRQCRTRSPACCCLGFAFFRAADAYLDIDRDRLSFVRVVFEYRTIAIARNTVWRPRGAWNISWALNASVEPFELKGKNLVMSKRPLTTITDPQSRNFFVF